MIFANEIALETELGEPDTNDGHPNETFADEVDSFPENAAHDSESHEGF